MQQLVVLLLLFFVNGAFLGSVQADELNTVKPDGLPTCSLRIPSPPSKRINPLVPREVVKTIEVGYTCQISTSETRPNSSEGYKPVGPAVWTLVQKMNVGDKVKEIWAVDTQRWGPIFVGYLEADKYTWKEAKDICNRQEEVVFFGKTLQIEMTLPEYGFGVTDIDNPLNFELLSALNHYAVFLNEGRTPLWSKTFEKDTDSVMVFNPYTYPPSTEKSAPDEKHSVRCVGL